MALNILTFAQLVQTQAAAIQAKTTQIIDVAAGAVMRAFIESNAAIGLWLESLAVYVLTLTRAATSAGPDLDSWMNDFGLTRLAAIQATGTVTANRYTATAAGLVPVGAQFQTTDGTRTFTVIAQPANGAYSATLNGYPLAINVSSLGVPVQANNPGSAGNAAPGTVTVIYGSLPGIDFVTNASQMVGGIDAETDSAFRARFVNYLGTLSKATVAAVKAAVQGLQAGAACNVVEGQTLAGVTQGAFFYAVIDDGSGNPPAAFVTAATAAIVAVRGAGIAFAIYTPSIVTVNVSMTITTAANYNHTTVAAAVNAAIVAFLNTLPLGTSLPFTRLAQIAYDASPGVTNVSGVLLNSGTADLAVTPNEVVKAGTISVS